MLFKPPSCFSSCDPCVQFPWFNYVTLRHHFVLLLYSAFRSHSENFRAENIVNMAFATAVISPGHGITHLKQSSGEIFRQHTHPNCWFQTSLSHRCHWQTLKRGKERNRSIDVLNLSAATVCHFIWMFARIK